MIGHGMTLTTQQGPDAIPVECYCRKRQLCAMSFFLACAADITLTCQLRTA